MKRIIVAVILLLSIACVGWGAEAARFTNARFGFRVDIPQDVFKLVVPEPENGDGFVFISRKDADVRLRFSAIYNVLEETVADELEATPEGAVILEKSLRNDRADVRYERGNTIVWRVSWLQNDTFYHASLEAPKKKFDRYGERFERILKTWAIL